MKSKTYRLFYSDVEVGKLLEEDYDFPNFYGKFTPGSKHGDEEIHKRIRAYIEYSIESSRMIEEDCDPAEQNRFARENDYRFLDLIESNEWHLLDDGGRRVGILSPNFCTNNEVVYRLNLEG